MNKVISPFFQIIIASIIRGSGGVLVKLIALAPQHLAFFRLSIPTIIIGIWIRYKQEKIFTHDSKQLFIVSSLNALRMRLFFIGYTYTSVGNAVVAQYTKPIILLILATYMLGEHITKKKIQSISIACVGIFLLYSNKEFSFGNTDIVGISAILLSALISAYINIVFKQIIQKHSSYHMIFYQCIVGASIFFLILLFTDPEISTYQITLSTIYAIFIGIIGFGLYFHSLKYLSVGTANMLSYTEMISAIILAYSILGEIPERNTFVGACFIIGAVYQLRHEK